MYETFIGIIIAGISCYLTYLFVRLCNDVNDIKNHLMNKE